MPSYESLLFVFEQLRQRIVHYLKPMFENGKSNSVSDFETVVAQASVANPWFTKQEVNRALNGIVLLLKPDELKKWFLSYQPLIENKKKKLNTGIIAAGNIPMVGFHDLLCVLFSGNKAIVKLSESDRVLMLFIIDQLISIDPEIKSSIQVVDKIAGIDSVIATGSNNSSRYFEYYFGKYPHIIRKNRNSAAVLTGKETKEELDNLGLDVFSYFGLGCRNVSKLYVPEGYSFDPLFNSFAEFGWLMNHNKYMNNYEYYNSILLLKQIPFLTNNFVIIKEDETLATPVAVLNYEYYKNNIHLSELILAKQDQLQCLVGSSGYIKNEIAFGQSQSPSIYNYADNVDTMSFLLKN